MKIALLATCLVSLSCFVSCAGPVINAISSTTTRNVIKAKNDSQIEYVDEAVSNQSQLPGLIRKQYVKLDGELLPLNKIGELSVSVDQATTFGFAKEVVTELQVAGHQVAMVSGEKKIVAPPMATQASDGPDVLLTVKLSSDADGNLTATELLVENKSLAKSSVDAQHEVDDVAQTTGQKVQEWLAKNEARKVAIELDLPQKLLAADAITICSTVTELANKQNSATEIWPFGFPRETPPKMNMSFDEVSGELETEPSSDSNQTKPAAEFKLD